MAEDDVDRLYGLPLDEFTAARNELAKRLGSKEVRALKKPSVAAWAVNQLARSRRAEVGKLLKAGERLRRAQETILAGRGSRDDLDVATRAERDLVRGLVEAAAGVLRDAGRAASDATLDRVRETLHAAALDESVAEQLAAGRLAEEQRAVGMGGLAVPAPRKGGDEGKRPERKTERAGVRDEERRRAREEAQRRKRELSEARKRERQAERELKAARKELTRADTALQQAREDCQRAARGLEQAEAAHEQAQRGVARLQGD